jgi:hypothetical protein
MAYDIGNPDPDLGQALTCGGVKPVKTANGIVLLIVEDLTVTEIQNSNKNAVPLLELCRSVMLNKYCHHCA